MQPRSNTRTRTSLHLSLALSACASPQLTGPPNAPLTFPADHGLHPEAQTEWWYLQGIVETDEGRELAVFLSMLRHDPGSDRLAGVRPPLAPGAAMLGWACVADLQTGERVSERWTGGAVPAPGHHVVGTEDWFSIRAGRWQTWGGGGRFTWQAPTALGDLTVHATPTTAPLIVAGPNQPAGEAASGRHHLAAADYSYAVLPRVALHGALERRGEVTPLSGTGWVEHQYGFIYSPRYLGWWWAVVMLDDGTDLLLVNVLPRDPAVGVETLGTVRRPGEGAESTGAFELQPLGTWTSARTGATYPSGLRAVVPGEDLELELLPRRVDSEWRVKPAPIWEGPVTVSGTRGGEAVTGWGFVEYLVAGEVLGRDLLTSGREVAE